LRLGLDRYTDFRLDESRCGVLLAETAYLIMNRYLIALSGALIAIPLSAQQLTVSIGAFGDPQAFMITDGSNLSLRVAELVPAPGANNSTHVLVEGLSPVEEGTLNYASPYRGINSASGEEQDLGVIYLQMPETAALPAGTVSSPIVGVLQRSGSWSDFELEIPGTSIGGASGASSYDPANTSLSLTLERGGETFTGTTTYTAVDTDTLELAPFTLVKDGASSHDLSGATLLRDGTRFYGTLTNLSSSPLYDSLLFSIELTDIPDVDGDGLPDISDPEIGSDELIIGEWTTLSIGRVMGLTDTIGYSEELGIVHVGHLPFAYSFAAGGWVSAHSTTADGRWLYHDSKGWIFVLDNHAGWYYGFPAGSGVGDWNHFQHPRW
jgi:hypothetical protein